MSGQHLHQTVYQGKIVYNSIVYIRHFHCFSQSKTEQTGRYSGKCMGPLKVLDVLDPKLVNMQCLMYVTHINIHVVLNTFECYVKYFNLRGLQITLKGHCTVCFRIFFVTM